MLYASIALVAAGIALIVYSFIVRERARSTPAPINDIPLSGTTGGEDGAPARPASRRDDGEMEAGAVSEGAGEREEAGAAPKPVRESRAVAENESAGSKQADSKEEPVAAQSAPAPVEEIRATVKEAPGPVKAAADEPNTAVLYHDASGVVDYEGRENVIDPSFKKYSKLKRIGRGGVRVVKDGINFQLRKKLYRFEFYRIEKMLPGKNYVAIFLKGSDEARLLIFDRNSDLDRRLIGEFRAFKKRSQ